MLDFQLKVQKPLKDLVYYELKHKILTGEIAADTRLMEIDLSDSMNVSRTPIREAIKKLEEDGLVKIEPRRGAYVKRISIKDLLDVFEVREEMEGYVAELASERITKEQKEELAKIASEYEQAIKNSDKEAMIELDEKFHNYIVECCNNSTLATLVNYIQELSLRFRYLYYDDLAISESAVEQHNRILRAITDGRDGDARTEAKAHVRALTDFIRDFEKSMEEEDENK